ANIDDDQQRHTVRRAAPRSPISAIAAWNVRPSPGETTWPANSRSRDPICSPFWRRTANGVDVVGIVGFVLEYEQLADATTWNDRLAITAVGVAMALASDLAEEVVEWSNRRRDSSTRAVGARPGEGRRSLNLSTSPGSRSGAPQ